MGLELDKMQRTTRTLAAALLYVLCAHFFSPEEARADTVVITSGYVQITNVPLSRATWNTTVFNFSGGGVSAQGSSPDGIRQRVSQPCGAFDPCLPGTSISPNSVVTLTGIGFASAGGPPFPAWYFSNDSALTFSGMNVVLPLSGPQTLVLTTTFTMYGNLVLHPLDATPNVQTVFSGLITGEGTATITLDFIEGSGGRPAGYYFRSIRYDFSPAAVPEPATLLLFGTGLAGVAVRYRRRARKSSR